MLFVLFLTLADVYFLEFTQSFNLIFFWRRFSGAWEIEELEQVSAYSHNMTVR